MWSVARRPRWIAALIFALALAAVFAALSQWQLARSVSTGTVVTRDTETLVDLDTIAKPQAGVVDAAAAQLVKVTGAWVPDDYLLVSGRLNGGNTGYWVVGHFAANVEGGNPAGLAVALGWAPDRAKAASAMEALSGSQASGSVSVAGRYFPDEGPQDSDFEHGKLSTLSAGSMINIWKATDSGGVYGGYLVDSEKASGLAAIDSPAPSSDVEVNLLNIFYAAEWVVFAGFALFLWYRLVKDAWEREQEEAQATETAEVN
ncbi:SURF1 family cytochrome oxidase biogenesis protein [Glaciihabitans sp. UYNi722]|uniref:SURF1 family cytochrome oxidase biogenesis protein n=1 Tax=Glaciihabitans sp. UYNi722 TaxID=3156344 RepID=UPI003397130C